MKSTSGEHFIGLDHVRAVAAFIVFTWHFMHGPGGHPVPFEGAPSFFPMAILDEGHTGVALFMVLSGYLFAKLLETRSIISYKAFLWNRFLRLGPLLVVVLAINMVIALGAGTPSLEYLRTISQGIVFPHLPNGGWSITVEFHFYLILPLLLWLIRRSKWLVLLLLTAALMLRSIIFFETGEVQSLAYWTIIGRIDQFLLGILISRTRYFMSGRHAFMAGCLIAFSLFYWQFDMNGGFYLNPSYPSPSPLWIFMPTIEGVIYAMLIAWYDTSFQFINKGISKLLSQFGSYSYSMYLIHFFFVFRFADFINAHIMNLSNFYIALCWSFACYLLLMPLAALSFHLIEKPFLKFRKPYLSKT